MKTSRFFISQVLLQVFFLLFLLTSCEKIKDIFTDEYAFLKGEWVIDSIQVSKGSQNDIEGSSYFISHRLENDSLVRTVSQKVDWEYLAPDITKYAFNFSLNIDKDVLIEAYFRNHELGVNNDTSYRISYITEGITNDPNMEYMNYPLENYAVMFVFGKNRVAISGATYSNIGSSILYAKKTQIENQLVLEYKIISGQEPYGSIHNCKYTFKRK
ncbi:MAG: hypothetical protein J7K39_02305 [Bacteroidales bacterium]|nr:hypothetical protein [Bacteroidales bacterium]